MPTYPMIVYCICAPCRNEAFLQLRVAVRVLGVALNLIARFHSHIFFLFCEDPGRRAPLSWLKFVTYTGTR